MNSQLFFSLNLLFGAIFLVWFLIARKEGSRKPTRLRLRAGQRTFNAPVDPLPRAATQTHTSMGGSYTYKEPSSAAPPTGRILNVFFLYNGHDWDAYEVLGLPAGTGMTTVTERYQSLISKAERGQMEFYEAAYQAILKK